MARAKYLKELPPSSRGKYPRAPRPEHVRMADKLKRKPEHWLMVRECSSPSGASRMARYIKTGTYLAFRDGTYEARVDHNQVFARYMGER